MQFQPKQRVELDVWCALVRMIPKALKNIYLVKLQTDDAREFTWWASRPALLVGKKYHVRATVKRIGTYQGRPDVVLTRVREWDPTPKPKTPKKARKRKIWTVAELAQATRPGDNARPIRESGSLAAIAAALSPAEE